MKISSKLFLGNSIYALIVVLICMGAITAFGILNNSIKETSSGTLQIFKTLEELKFNGLRIVSSTVEFVLIINEENGKKNPEGQKKTEKELVEMGINNSYSSLEKYLILIKKYSPEDSVYYKHINGILVRLINAGSEIINSKESGAGKSEILKEKEMFEKDEADFLAAVDDVLIKKESERKSKEDAIEASLKMSRDIILYTILFSFIVISIIWYMLKKSISLPISRLRDATIKLRGGNYDSSVVVSTNDEIGELSYSFNNMVNKLGETFENLNLEIKERKKVEIELQQSESRFRSLIEKSSEGICSIEKDGKMIYASPVGNKILGYENGGLTGFMMFEFIHPSDLQPTLIQLNKILEKPGSSISYQFRLKHKEGHYIWIRATATNLLEHPNLNAIVVNYHDISLRKEAEDKLIASEKRFREFADFLPQLVFEYDIKGAFTFANRASFEATGYTPDDIKKGFTVFNLIDPLQHQIVVEMMKKRLSKVPSNGTEYNIIRKDGSSFPAIAYASLVEENGEVKGIRGIVVDITERKKYELILKQNAAKLKLLNDIGSKIASSLALDEIMDKAVKLVHENFKYNHVSLLTYNKEEDYLILKAIAGAFIGLFNRDVKIFLEKGMIIWAAKTGNIIVANDVSIDPHYFNAYPDMINTRSELSIPLKIGAKVFGILDIQCKVVNAFSEEDINVLVTLADQIALAINNSLLYQAVQQELRERIKAEEALQHSEEKYRSVFANVPLGIAHYDSSGILTDCNDIFLQVFDINKEAAVGFDLMKLEDKKLKEAFEIALTGFVGEYEGNYQSVISKKMISLKVAFAPIVNYDGKVMNTVGIFEDISERKQVERFFFHDILNTAGNLRNYSKLLSDSTLDDQEKVMIDHNVASLSNQIIDEIVSHRAILSSDKTEIKLNIIQLNTLEFLNKMVVNFKQILVKENKHFVIDVKYEALEIKTDGTILGRILSNLIKNAIEVSISNGVITVGCNAENDRVNFWVHNQTMIPDDIKSRIFQRSFSTKGGDRGIGTYSLKFLTEQYLKGEVSFISNEEDGTTFNVVIPKTI